MPTYCLVLRIVIKRAGFPSAPPPRHLSVRGLWVGFSGLRLVSLLPFVRHGVPRFINGNKIANRACFPSVNLALSCRSRVSDAWSIAATDSRQKGQFREAGWVMGSWGFRSFIFQLPPGPCREAVLPWACASCRKAALRLKTGNRLEARCTGMSCCL